MKIWKWRVSVLATWHRLMVPGAQAEKVFDEAVASRDQRRSAYTELLRSALERHEACGVEAEHERLCEEASR